MKQFLLLALLCSIGLTAPAQTPESLLQKIHKEYNAEKIFVHYDKVSYIAGETIWFKAYLMNGYLPSRKSTVFYLELLNDSGNVVAQRLLPVMGSACVGDIAISQHFPSGNYFVKAYTRNLMNLGYESFYYHRLSIHNPKTLASPVLKANTYVLDFFPEGGSLIAGIKNIVAFKCTDQYGRPAFVEGKVRDAGGNVVLNFKSEHDGMGRFEFTPSFGATYTAENFINGTVQIEKALPPAITEGVGMIVSHQDAKKYFHIDASTVTSEEMLPAYVLGVQENIVVFKVPTRSKKIKAQIPSGQLLTGILQLTVFNKNHKPLAERLVFNNSGDYLPEVMLQEKIIDLKPRAKNTFAFQLKDTIPGTFSVAVTSADVEQSSHENIVSRLLLTADLKGRVANPAYYFEKNDEQHQQHLDLVMLTNGWRRYSWDDMFAGKFPVNKEKDPNYISMKAIALNKMTRKPLALTELTIFTKTKDGRTSLSSITTDSLGQFEMSGMAFEDTASFSFKVNAKKQDVNVKLMTTVSQKKMYSVRTPLPIMIPADSITKTQQEQASVFEVKRFDGILLDEIRLKAKTKSELQKYEEKHVSGLWAGSATRTLDFLTKPPGYDERLFDYLQGNLNSVNISGGPIEYFLSYRNTGISDGGVPMTIYLDEFEVEPSTVATLNISEVALIKLFPNSAITGLGGALAIYTKRRAGLPVSRNIPLKEFQVEGFSPTKEFFSPDYSDSANLDIDSDQRTTLYWNPYLVSNSGNNSIRFSFYNTDKTKRYKVVLQGILADGKIMHIEDFFE